jgi:hypothetical protein
MQTIIHPDPDRTQPEDRPRVPTTEEISAHAAAHGEAGGALWRLRGSYGLALCWWLEVPESPYPHRGVPEFVKRYGEIIAAHPCDLRGRPVAWPEVAP